jgi:hypothetical protein
MDDEDFEGLLRQVYTKVSISMDMGVALVSEHRPWLNARKPSIDPFYWQRFQKLLSKKGLFARIWEKRRFAGILRFCEFGYTRFHEGERLDASTGLAWV